LPVCGCAHFLRYCPYGGFFSGGDAVFGPYRATDISRSGVRTTGSGWTLKGTKIGSSETDQDYTYQFVGKSTWDADCKVEKGQSQIGIVSGRFYADLTCTFVPADSKSSSEKGWIFRFKGETTDRSSGNIKMGSKTITVKATDKLQGSPLRMGQNTGYYFYSGQKIIAGVDVISKVGPVWMNNSLSQDERDIIGMVMVALLLNQTD
jgi:hypothetical protein